MARRLLDERLEVYMHRPTILISDDEPLVVSVLTRLARRHGLEVVSDTSSDRVMELAKLTKPSLILMDVRQRVDGRVLLARLKRDPDTRSIKVLMLSGADDPVARRICLDLGAVDYELKPFGPGFMAKVCRLAAA